MSSPALVDPNQMLSSVFSNCWIGPQPLKVDEWADAYRFLPVKGSPRPGPWSTDLVPYLRDPMRDYTNPKVSQIVMMTASQVGKTELLLNLIGYTIDAEPNPMMVVFPSQKLAQSVNSKRIIPSILESPALARHLGASVRDAKAMAVSLDTCTIQLMGANSASGLASEPIGRGFGDELDKWPQELKGRGGTEGSALDLLRQRLDAFDLPKLVLASTPTDEGIGIHAEYLRSDQAKYHVPCPICGGYQWLHFHADGGGGVRWDGGVGEQMDDEDHAALVQAVKKSAWYQCEKCEGRIESHHKSRMLSAGKWVRAGQTIDSDGEIVGEPILEGVRGYQLSKLYSPFRTFGDVASEFVRIRGQVDRAFVNGHLGEPWMEAGERAENDLIIRLSQERYQGVQTYKLGEVPSGVLKLIGSIDVQSDVCYWQIAGYGQGEERWLIDYGVERCPEVVSRDLKSEGDPEVRKSLLENNWALMDRVVDRVMTRQSDGQPARVQYWAIDSGDRTGEVYRFAARHKGRILPTKGSDQIASPWQVSATDPIKFKMETSVDLLIVNANHWRDHVWQRMHRQPPAWGAWHWPTDIGREYSRQLASEQRKKKTLRGGKFKWVWELRPGRKDNHWWDCTVDEVAFADHMGIRDLRPASGSNRIDSGGLTPGSFGTGPAGA